MSDNKLIELDANTSGSLVCDQKLAGLVKDEVAFLLGEDSSFENPIDEFGLCDCHAEKQSCALFEGRGAEVSRAKKRYRKASEMDDCLKEIDFSTRTAKEVRKQ